MYRKVCQFFNFTSVHDKWKCTFVQYDSFARSPKISNYNPKSYGIKNNIY